MLVDWAEIQKALVPLKDYEDCCRRFEVSFAYPFVCKSYNLNIPELMEYSQKLLGGDARGRYTEYLALLDHTFSLLYQAGVENVLDLVKRLDARPKLESFIEQSGIEAHKIISVLKYLIYWFIPGEKYLSGLVRDDSSISAAIQVLGGLGVRTNLQILQLGLTPAGRRSLAASSGLPEQVILELVNRADFSRLPWASKATISNLIGAGYGSLTKLANANPEQLYADFFAYGESISKNLKLGNEIENSYRIARIVPKLVEDDQVTPKTGIM